MTLLEELIAAEGEVLPWPDYFPPRLSPSSIAQAASCPEKWRRKYVLGEREPWGGAAIVGLAVHRAAETNFAQKVETGEDLPLNLAGELAAVAFEDKTAEAEKDGIEWGDVKPGDAKDQAVGLYRLYHEQRAPSVQPVAVESWVEVQLPGLPELFGRVDVMTDTRVLDVKTTGRKMLAPRGDWRLKGMLYSRMTGLGVSWDVLTKTKTPALYSADEFPGLDMAATPALHRLTERRVRAEVAKLIDMLERYGPEAPWPTNAPEHEWACSYCGHRPTCAWWAS